MTPRPTQGVAPIIGSEATSHRADAFGVVLVSGEEAPDL
jgi:hypothetical protein